MSDTEELDKLREESTEPDVKVLGSTSNWESLDAFLKWCLLIYCLLIYFLSTFHLIYEYSLDEVKQDIVVSPIFIECMFPICFFFGIISLSFIRLLSARRSLIIFLHCPLFILINGFLTRQAFICMNLLTTMSETPDTVLKTVGYTIKMYIILGLILIGIMVLTCFGILQKDSSSTASS